MTDSQQLLAAYVQSGSEDAFLELLTRYLDLVFRARCVIVVLSVLGGWVVYRWGRDLFAPFRAMVGAAEAGGGIFFDGDAP